jgi:SAM-dependent methyltransferase
MIDLNSRYEDKSFVDKYAAIWSYGYINGMGESEGLYRTINAIGFEAKRRDGKHTILDVGCGVGRTSCDYARFFYNSKIIAIDQSKMMIETATSIVKNRDDKILFNLTEWGFPTLSITSFGLFNVEFIQTSLEFYYLNHRKMKNSFDMIIGVNFLDRTNELRDSCQIIYDLLDRDGVFIGSTPLSLRNAKGWVNYGSVEKIIKLFNGLGFKVQQIFDNLLYREVLDGRKSYEDYNTMVFKVAK